MIKILSLFSGIGAYEKALKKLKIEFEIINFCELNKQASFCYSKIHNIDESKNIVDVESIKVKELEDFDLLTFSPPCQDISTIGKHAGVGTGTRTGLMWKVVDIIKIKKPKFLLMENVSNLNGKYKPVFEEYLKTLNDVGYDCYFDVLNAKDYGIPQNRKRLFMVGIRKDLNQKFEMPKKQKLKKTLKDFLDTDEKIETINKDISYTIRIGGRKSKVGNKHNWDGYIVNDKIYYLSGKDCFKLMGFSEADYDKLIKSNVRENCILKVSGNSVVVNVLEAIFKNIFIKQK